MPEGRRGLDCIGRWSQDMLARLGMSHLGQEPSYFHSLVFLCVRYEGGKHNDSSTFVLRYRCGKRVALDGDGIK